MFLSSAQMLPFFLWVNLARAYCCSAAVPLRGLDMLLLLHMASSLALYIHLRNGYFGIARRSLLHSIAAVQNTFDLVGPTL